MSKHTDDQCGQAATLTFFMGGRLGDKCPRYNIITSSLKTKHTQF